MNHPSRTVKVTADVMTRRRSAQRRAGLCVRTIEEAFPRTLRYTLPLCTRGAISAARQKPASRAVALETWLRVVLHCRPPVNP